MQENLDELWEVMHNYNLITYSISPYCRNIFRIETNEGSKALKICDRDKEKIIFIFSIMKHVWDNGFTKLSKPIVSNTDDACVIRNDEVYFLTEWVDGKKCDFKIIDDLKAACATLAQFHNVSFHDEKISASLVRCVSDKWDSTFVERLKELYDYKDSAPSIKSAFADAYLTNCDYFIALAEHANKMLMNSEYKTTAQQAIQKGFFTHRDVAGRNFIMVGKEAYLIDFDYARYDIRHTDIVRILERSLKLHNWSPEIGKIILDTYNGSSRQPLTKQDYKIILAFLTWPQKYWRLCNRYFKTKREWKEESFIKKMEVIVNKAQVKANFLNWLEEKFC